MVKNLDTMTNCPACGEEMAKSAKSCPKCGARNMKPFYKRPWFIILLVVLGLSIITGIFGGSSEKESTGRVGNDSKTEEVKAPPTDVTADALADALKSNALTAVDTYKGAYVRISGHLGNIDSGGSYFTIDNANEWDLSNLQCFMTNDDQRNKIRGMQKGGAIVVIGTITDVGEVLGYSVKVESIE